MTLKDNKHQKTEKKSCLNHSAYNSSELELFIP